MNPHTATAWLNLYSAPTEPCGNESSRFPGVSTPFPRGCETYGLFAPFPRGVDPYGVLTPGYQDLTANAVFCPYRGWICPVFV